MHLIPCKQLDRETGNISFSNTARPKSEKNITVFNIFKPLFHRNDTHEWRLNVIRRNKHSCFAEKQVISITVEVKRVLQIPCGEHSYYKKLVNRTLLYKVMLLKYFNFRLGRKDKIPK